MKRNSGIVGAKSTVGASSAVGVFDTFDAYSFKKSGSWPTVVSYNSITPNSGTILENTVAGFTLDTSGFAENATLYWTILNGTTTNSDFYNSVVSGSFTQTASTNTGAFSITTAFIGNPAKTARTFQILIRTGSTSGPVVYSSSTYTIPAITSSVVWAPSSANEGSSSSLQVTLGNIGSFSGWTASISYSGSATSADFSVLPSTMLVASGLRSATFNLLSDVITEGAEILTATVTYGGATLGVATLNINDTSTAVSATVTPDSSSKNEDGTAVTFTVNTTGFTSGTLYYSVLPISGSVSNSDFTQNIGTGSFSISNSTGSFALNIAADILTEGTESFQVQVRVNSTVGPVVGTSSTVTINDTSLSPGLPSYITLGSKLPTAGPAGSSPHPPTGWTSLQNASADDAFVTFTSPFSVTINNTAYTTHYPGSNGYITWGSGRTEYSGLSATNPPQNKLMLGAADNSYQRVSTITNGTLYTRVRYEGNGSTSGTVGSPGIVWEVTFFNPANYGGVPVIEILVGNHNRTSGVTSISTTSVHMLTWTISSNTAYVLVGNSTGTVWTRYNGFINNSGY